MKAGMRIHSLFTPTAEQKAKFTHAHSARALGSRQRALGHAGERSGAAVPGTGGGPRVARAHAGAGTRSRLAPEGRLLHLPAFAWLVTAR